MSSAILSYNQNNKQIALLDPETETETPQTNIAQINKLTADLIAESNPNFTPQPKEEASKLIKNLFETGLKQIKQNKLPDALKSITLAIQMAKRKRTSYEAFGIQLQELQFMLRQKIDLQLLLGKFVDALEDLEFLLGTGMASNDVFIRKTDALLKLKKFQLAKVAAERGLSLHPNDTKLKALMMECNRNLVEFNGEI
ncbi:hypothetical protein NCAS_0D03070 [Naumovozyma castellii]|uniref:Uncharacterized protein n=1 Tax=Naumovozyma castellii TaxID=27288 RepID=G0VE97_NAUCA|nr:hypothetical protein NCAS_0D03070 [Naumovozyma castellii CBS 4309]CCC69888.1 hypothetical protein NCAS_0D03070 [Naumovozyma castellii CBS 4309]